MEDQEETEDPHTGAAEITLQTPPAGIVDEDAIPNPRIEYLPVD